MYTPPQLFGCVMSNVVMSSLPSFRQGTSQAVESEAAVPHTAGAAQVPGNINEDHPHHQVSGSSLYCVVRAGGMGLI